MRRRSPLDRPAAPWCSSTSADGVRLPRAALGAARGRAPRVQCAVTVWPATPQPDEGRAEMEAALAAMVERAVEETGVHGRTRVAAVTHPVTVADVAVRTGAELLVIGDRAGRRRLTGSSTRSDSADATRTAERRRGPAARPSTVTSTGTTTQRRLNRRRGGARRRGPAAGAAGRVRALRSRRRSVRCRAWSRASRATELSSALDAEASARRSSESIRSTRRGGQRAGRRRGGGRRGRGGRPAPRRAPPTAAAGPARRWCAPRGPSSAGRCSTGSSGPARSIGAGCSETTDIMVAIASPRANGGRPSTAAYSVAPSDQRSTGGRGSSPLTRSGAM